MISGNKRKILMFIAWSKKTLPYIFVYEGCYEVVGIAERGQLITLFKVFCIKCLCGKNRASIANKFPQNFTSGAFMNCKLEIRGKRFSGWLNLRGVVDLQRKQHIFKFQYICEFSWRHWNGFTDKWVEKLKSRLLAFEFPLQTQLVSSLFSVLENYLTLNSSFPQVNTAFPAMFTLPPIWWNKPWNSCFCNTSF